jgi:hypothetical protein
MPKGAPPGFGSCGSRDAYRPGMGGSSASHPMTERNTTSTGARRKLAPRLIVGGDRRATSRQELGQHARHEFVPGGVPVPVALVLEAARPPLPVGSEMSVQINEWQTMLGRALRYQRIDRKRSL